MIFKLNRILLSAMALGLSLAGVPAQVYLTDVVVFSTDAGGNWVNPDTWETRPGGNFNVWIQDAGTGTFLNGPSDAAVRPNILVTEGSRSFRFLAAPGLDAPLFGINLFFNGSSTPSISAFGPMLSAPGPHSFVPDAALHTPMTVPGYNTGYLFPGAGTLSFVQGDQIVTLTDFYWAAQSVAGVDLTGQSSIGPDGALDYSGGITLSVTPVPEPQLSFWALGLLAVCRMRRSLPRFRAAR